MKRIRYIMLCVCCLLLAGCGKQQEEATTEHTLLKNEIYGYYVNADLTDVVKKELRIKLDQTVAENADAVMKDLVEMKATNQLQSPIPGGAEYTSCQMDEKRGRLTVSFQILYDEVNADSLLFLKVCVVKTLLQLENVNRVTISLTDRMNKDPETATTSETFDNDSFAMSFGNSNGYQQNGNIILYFASPDGEKLKEYHKAVKISNNTSLAEIVVSSLIEGPKQDGYQATIPENTTIHNISVKDGICYVDLSEEFYTTDNPMRNDIIVYSIVDSLVELPTVSKVQFLKNGEKLDFFRETMPFDTLFERNLDLIEQEETTEEDSTTQETTQ